MALTSIASKNVATYKEHFAKLAVEAVKQVAERADKGKLKVDIDQVKVLKKHGKSLEETELVRGIVIDKEAGHSQMPKLIEGAKIALLNAKLEIKKTEFDAKVNIESPEQMKLFLDEEERMLKEMVAKVVETGANVVLCEKGIDDMALHFLARNYVMAAKNLSSSDMEELAKAAGGKIVTCIKDLTREMLGEAQTVEEVKIGDDKLIYVKGCKNPKAVTIVVRGGTEHVIDEAERSLHDALCVVRSAVEDGKIVAGGGSSEAEVAKRLRDYAVRVGGREQLAIEAFAEAVETTPLTLAENAGMDPIDIMVASRSKHEKEDGASDGVDVFSGEAKNMLQLNIVEPLRVKSQAVKSATEAASMILKIDDLIASKDMERDMPKGPHGGPSEFE